MLELNNIYLGDCLEIMKEIPSKSIDMILCDLPYGITKNSWDVIIPFDKLWNEYLRITKQTAAMVFTANGLFTVDLIQSMRKYYRYSLVWEKNIASGFLNANKMPLRSHEDIVVFYKNTPIYNPQFTNGKAYTKKSKIQSSNYNYFKPYQTNNKSGDRFPRSIIYAISKRESNHPTEKPVELFEYLIKTYTNEGDLVLDNCIGSGTTAIAAINTNRNFIGIEKNQDYFNESLNRLKKSKEQMRLLL